MNAKLQNTPAPWVDPDDAPELTDDFFANATPMIGGKVVSREEVLAEFKKRIGRPPLEVTRPVLNMRVDADVMTALRASGKGWQTRVNEILRREVLGKGAKASQ